MLVVARSSLRLLTLATWAASSFVPRPAGASPPCGAVELRFTPGAKDMQIVAWIEDGDGKHVATPYITRVTGQFGLANRPGLGTLKTDYRWPYGRREMVAPIWAHRRGKKYPRITMGGACGNSPGTCKGDPTPPTFCPNGIPCGCECNDKTIAYHGLVSSAEPFYCSPSGPGRLDAMSCASRFTGSKGAYLPFPKFFSYYPPRADLVDFDARVDSPDMTDFAKRNDLVAVSQATPPADKPLDPPLVWFPEDLPHGEYVAWIELSQESDFNAAHNHESPIDDQPEWDFEGHDFLGQPSVVYRLPFGYRPEGGAATTRTFWGYSTWDGSDGTIHPPDGTITDRPGSGAGRLLDVEEGGETWRFKVTVGACTMPPPTDGGTPTPDAPPPPICEAPGAISDLRLAAKTAGLEVTFRGPSSGPAPERYAVRYREGTSLLGGEDFDAAVAGAMVRADDGAMSASLDGLLAGRSYAVGVRALAACGKAGPVVSQVMTTGEHTFKTLEGCFVATVAWGSPMEGQVEALRRFRNRHLATNPGGQLLTTLYYAFGPPLAAAVATDERLRAATREALQPLVDLVTTRRRD